MKIAILGYCGSGKSTLSTVLGEQYSLPVLHLDKVQFLPFWEERDREEAREMVSSFMQKDAWIIDGNYQNFFQKERLEQADQIIILTFNRFNCLLRAVKRYFRYRGKTRESIAEGCNEKIDFEFIWWILYAGRTKEKRRIFSDISRNYQEKTTIISNQKQLDLFVQSCTAATRTNF